MGGNGVNILIGGEAGQGLVTVGQLLAKTLVRSGDNIVVTQSYESRIRGGHNTFTVRTSPDEIVAPQEPVDILVALNAETVTLHQREMQSEGTVIVDEAVNAQCERCIRVPFKRLGSAQMSNVVALGVVGFMLGLDESVVAGTVDDLFGHKDPRTAEENRRVLAETYRWSAGQSLATRQLPRVGSPARRLMLNGNDAIALGALSAGLRFYSFYPMTPSTSIAWTLAAQARRMGIVVEQAEDEISAINMALGASFAGAPSMVATSGGGFALMVEGVSLAGMTETPIVIVVGQRPGPATGLPTRSEQADLEFVLHAGHGEFPRAILTPGTVEECFQLTRQAFALAERSQGPVFILTDQFLADSYRAVDPFDVGALSELTVGAPSEAISEPYHRHALTETGISPRLLPGLSEHLVVTDSDEHTEDGHLTEDLVVRKRMVEKRLRKHGGILEEVTAPEFSGDEHPDLLLLCWGSGKGAVLEAAVL